MAQSTLEQATSNYIRCTPLNHLHHVTSANAFKAGAEWQKEQSKELIAALKELVECDYTSGTHLSCALIRGKNALLSIGELPQD